MKRSPMKRSPFTKKAQETLRKKKHRKAWTLMSLYVRKRDRGICVTCGKPGNQAGHFIHGKLDFDFQNINCQCSGCNCWKHGNIVNYAIYLQERYDYGIIAELRLRSNIVHKYEVDELDAIINNLEYLLGEK